MSDRSKAPSPGQRPPRIAGYVRVFPKEGENEWDKLADQYRLIRAWVKTREEWREANLKCYTDVGTSAEDQNRPELQRLKRDVAAGKIDVVICFKLDRITRSFVDFIILWDLFERHAVDVISLR